VPAAPLRGLANGGSPCPVRNSLARAKSASVMKTSPRTSTVTGSARVRGNPATSRACGVTSSPACPSPRVTSRSSRPPAYRADTAIPSIFGSTVYPPAGRPSTRSSRPAQARSPSSSNTLSRLSIGVLCGTSPPAAPAPTVTVGDAATVHSGRAASVAATRATSESYSASSMTRPLPA
jgi:hypothetical protein